MAHGYPDYGASHPKAELYAGIDMAELAARLGALPRYDRLGDVIFYEDFGGDLGAWQIETSGAGEAVVVTAERKVTGSFSCRLSCVVAAGSYAGIRWRAPVPYSIMYGVEIQWTVHADMTLGYVIVNVYTGAFHLAFGIMYDKATNLNYYFNAAGGWTAIPGLIIPYYSTYHFNVTKFTFNISTLRYSRLLTPPLITDLSACTGFAFPDMVNRPRMECAGRLYGDPATTPVSYIDNLILTANDF